ncbi:aarF domain-containing kinase [Angomonas deanei]|nr:aarF domain-containing kinase [Angomonas deanei]|eukprot:EPY41573.1 aarF domain-containing kinase [Angomonas deanei]
MFHATVPRASPLCNIAAGLGKIVSTMLPGGTTSTPSMGSTASSTSSFPGTFSTQYGGGGKTEAVPDEALRELRPTGPTGSSHLRYKSVPSTRGARAVGFASLFMHLGWEKLSGATPEGALLSGAGHQRIVDTLCRMRGAVLKLGQMLSIQDSSTVPPHVTALFEKVRDSAFAMPVEQLHRTLAGEFKDPRWREKYFTRFDDAPMAAASIGQVHYGELKAIPGATWPDGTPVAVKVQYPGVAKSIDSDVANLKMLMALNILPPGMFVDSILVELRNELNLECQYKVEAVKQERYGKLIDSTPSLNEVFHVPKVYKELCTDQVLVTEYIQGVPVDRVAKNRSVPQSLKNNLASKLMELTLNELFVWRFMQTDPNYANFLYNVESNKVHLLDFGAAREYDREFVNDYLDVVAAAAREDREVIIEKSIKLGFLTGMEVKEMIDAHVSSVCLLGMPFRDRDTPFDFAAINLPAKIQAHVPTMVKLRLRPPPTPVYSLHRRLSGTILAATQLGATIPSGAVFWAIHDAEKKNLQ